MKSLLAAAIPALVASQAFAGFDFAQVHSTLYSSPQQESSNYGAGFGTISSELATGPYGNVISTMTTDDSSILMTSNMSINGGSTGNASATAIYTITSPITVTVTWDWTDLSQAGLWSVKQYGGALLQRLSFFDGGFSSVGGSYGQSPSGTATFELAAGIYEFSSSYTAVSMPATSSVEFNWGVIPAPGAAAFAVAGLIGRRRRA